MGVFNVRYGCGLNCTFKVYEFYRLAFPTVLNKYLSGQFVIISYIVLSNIYNENGWISKNWELVLHSNFSKGLLSNSGLKSNKFLFYAYFLQLFAYLIWLTRAAQVVFIINNN